MSVLFSVNCVQIWSSSLHPLCLGAKNILVNSPFTVRQHSDLYTALLIKILLFCFYFHRYNSQKALDTFLHGKPQQTSHVPFMVNNWWYYLDIHRTCFKCRMRARMSFCFRSKYFHFNCRTNSILGLIFHHSLIMIVIPITIIIIIIIIIINIYIVQINV